MSGKMYLCLFILCAVMSQGIVGIFLEDNIGESSNVLVREKRVISRHPDEDIPVEAGVFPYIVNIKSKNKRIIGIGSILSLRTVITASRAVVLDVTQYIVTSAATYTFLGVTHNVTNKEVLSNRSYRRDSGIALLTVNPPFEHRYSGIIGLHSEPVLAGMRGTVSGWGSTLYGGRLESRCPGRLRAITVPIISHRECVNAYRGLYEIRDDNVCTYHELKQCGASDVGAPLVIANELVGIHIGMIVAPQSIVMKPDIFILLQHSDYKQWINSHIVD